MDQIYERFAAEEAKLNSASLGYLIELAAWLAATFAESKIKNWKLPFMGWLAKKYEDVRRSFVLLILLSAASRSFLITGVPLVAFGPHC